MSSRNVIDLRDRPRRHEVAARHHTSAPSVMRAGRNSLLRAKRRRIRLIALGIFVALVITGVFAGSYVSYLPQYTINSVAIEGARSVPTQLIVRYVDTQLNTSTRPLFAHNNIFLFNTSALARNIVGFFPRIKSVHVSRASLFATTIMISVQERQEYALWCTQDDLNGCYSMDDTGFIFAQATTTRWELASSSVNKYVFSGGIATTSNPIGHTFAPGHLPGIIAFFNHLEPVGLMPMGATVDDNGADFTVHLAQSFDIKASFGQDPDALVRDLQLILESDPLKDKRSDIQYIDLRWGNRTYYKLKSTTVSL